MSATVLQEAQPEIQRNDQSVLPIEMTVLNGHGARAYGQIQRVAGLVLGEAVEQLRSPSRYKSAESVGAVGRLVAKGEFAMRLSYVPARYGGLHQPIHNGLAVATFGLYMRGGSMKIEGALPGKPTAGIQFAYRDRVGNKEHTEGVPAWVPVWAHADTKDGFVSVAVSDQALDPAVALLGSDTTMRAADQMGQAADTLAGLAAAEPLVAQLEPIGWIPITPVAPPVRV